MAIELSRPDAVKDAIASVRIEGLTIAPEMMKILDRYAAGELTVEEAKAISLSLVRRDESPRVQ